MIDLQAQQEGESERAYLAYTTYRDMPLPRSLRGSYEVYLLSLDAAGQGSSKKVGLGSKKPQQKTKKVGLGAPKPHQASKTYRSWMTEFRWIERARDWDNQRQQRIRAAHLEVDTKGFCERVEAMRSSAERGARKILQASEIVSSLYTAQANAISLSAMRDGRFTRLEHSDLRELDSVTKGLKASAETFKEAMLLGADAMGLVEYIKSLEKGR